MRWPAASSLSSEAQALVKAEGGDTNEMHGAERHVDESMGPGVDRSGNAFDDGESGEPAESSWDAFAEDADCGAEFDESLEMKAASDHADGKEFGSFAAFDEPSAQPLPVAPTIRGTAIADVDADDGDFADFGAPPQSAMEAVPASGGNGDARGAGTSGERRVRELERRLQMLEQTVSGGASRIDMLEHEQKLAQLTAQVDRRLLGVRKGM